MINGSILAGFATVAYPASKGESGVMTFIVNYNGAVYERDLGSETTKLARSMKIFGPRKGWNLVKPE